MGFRKIQRTIQAAQTRRSVMLRIYLKGKAADLKGFVPDERFPVVLGTCDGFHLYYENGRWRAESGRYRDPIPAWMAVKADEFSLYENLSREIRRESGIYRHGAAEAEVESSEGGKAVIMRIKSKNIYDLCQLVRLIKTGAIRPEESYEEAQSGQSRVELENCIAKLEGDSEYWKRKADLLRANVSTFLDDLSLGKLRWPLLTRKSVLRRFNELFYPSGTE